MPFYKALYFSIIGGEMCFEKYDTTTSSQNSPFRLLLSKSFTFKLSSTAHEVYEEFENVTFLLGTCCG